MSVIHRQAYGLEHSPTNDCLIGKKNMYGYATYVCQTGTDVSLIVVRATSSKTNRQRKLVA